MQSETKNEMEAENAENNENEANVANTKLNKQDQLPVAPINGANVVRVRNVIEINGSVNETNNNNVVNGENTNKRKHQAPTQEPEVTPDNGEEPEKQRKLENGMQIKTEPLGEDVGCSTSTPENMTTVKTETSEASSAVDTANGEQQSYAEASCSTASSSNNVLPYKAAVKVEKADASSTTRESCRFGIRCYRRNPAHRAEEAHPGDVDYRRPTYPSPPPGTPNCPYGSICYRRNPTHFKEYAHPPETDFLTNYKNRLRQNQLQQQQQQEQSISSSFNSRLDQDSDFEEDPFFDLDFDESDYVPSEEDDFNDDSDEYLGDYDDCDRAEE